MLYLEYSHPSPTHNLAMEELLLEPYIKNPNSPAICRVWSNEQKCIVIGRGEKIDQQVHLSNTEKHNVPVYRRISGGGTVLHGPHNINLSFFLPFSYHPSLINLKESYKTILSWVQKSLAESHQLDVAINGSCDLVLNNKKFSGTAQARKRHGILHHMTILLKADYKGMKNYLTEPSKRPDYREDRTHESFVIGLQDHLPSFDFTLFINSLKSHLSIQNVFELDEEFKQKVNQLAIDKYSQKTWNYEGKLA